MEKRPVILVVMDGIGIREDKKNNAVALANKPTLDKLWAECPHTQLRAHGLAVGLPTDSDMGNSEENFSKSARLHEPFTTKRKSFKSTLFCFIQVLFIVQ